MKLTAPLVAVAVLAGTSCSKKADQRPPAPAAHDAAVAVAPPTDAAPRPGGPSPFETFATLPPALGATALDFTLTDLDGATVTLSDAYARGPVVLVFGSFSCPPFRMKTPRFAQLARHWQGQAEVYYVFSEEAHAHAASSERLNGFATMVQGLDRDGDGAVTVAEYGTATPRFMFDAFDVNHDGVVRSHEFLAARRLPQFQALEAPRTVEERVTLAKRFRDEVHPDGIHILIDPIDNATAKAYGDLPNSALVIGKDGVVTLKLPWAAVADVERELARLTNAPPPAAERPDLTPIAPALAAAKAAGTPVLVELTAPGCDACKRMQETTLAEPAVRAALAGYQVASLTIDHDPAWRLFEQLDLGATPAFVIVAPDGTIGAHRQGLLPSDEFLAFLKQ